MEEGGPILWKALPGDRLAWVGWRTHKPTLVALFNCFRKGYVYGEPGEPTLESVMRFGTPILRRRSQNSPPLPENIWFRATMIFLRWPAFLGNQKVARLDRITDCPRMSSGIRMCREFGAVDTLWQSNDTRLV